MDVKMNGNDRMDENYWMNVIIELMDVKMNGIERMDENNGMNGCTDYLILPVLFAEPSRNLSLIKLGTNVLLHHPVILII